MKQMDVPVPPPMAEWEFVRELNRPVARKLRKQRSQAMAGEADLSGGVKVVQEFPDPELLLDTAYADLNTLLSENGLSGSYPVVTRQIETSCFEEYSIEITPERCVIAGADTEGIRRGIFEFEDLLQSAGGPFIKCQVIRRKPWLKSRISRCFFSPVKRWPVNTDELLDDINYYPDEYLNRLAHEAVNGLWLVVSMRELSETSFTPLDPQAEQRLTKLRATVRQCRRYGIKVFLFCIEPFGVGEGDPLFKEHPELFGANAWGRNCFCPCVPETRQFIREMFDYVFSRVDGLGGIINITHGERPTTCLSATSVRDNTPVPCPRCGKIPHGEIVRQSMQAIKDGIHKHQPDARIISWFYMPYPFELSEWSDTLASYMPEGVIAQFNYESGGELEQLGRKHYGGDYWLSYVGPAARFLKQAAAGKEISAKLQVGCGHELGTVPFIPAPEQIYRKFKAMKENGVEHAMHCWYLGNYPGLMNRAAGRLAFDTFESTEAEFLERLAAPDWGSATADAAKAWHLFSESYRQLPFSLMFQYYGPQNMGSGWLLSLFPELKPLAPPWKPDFTVYGDALGESMAGFDLEEALMLVHDMFEKWQQGIALLTPHRAIFAGNREREIDMILIHALGLQLMNANNVLLFCRLREELFSKNDDSVLEPMRQLLEYEITLSQRLAKLCTLDSRLGFQSEALCHRYYPALLEWRCTQVRKVLDEDFPALKQALADGTTAWDYFMTQPEAPTAAAPGEWRGFWKYEVEGDQLVISSKVKNGELWIYLIDRCGNRFPDMCLWKADGNGVQMTMENLSHVTAEKSPLVAAIAASITADGIELRLPLDKLPVDDSGKLRINLKKVENDQREFAFGEGYPHRLYLYDFSPHETGLISIK